MLPIDTRNTLYKHVDHVAVVVNNIEQAADFYRDVFQLDLIMGLAYPPDGVHTNLVFSLGPENELELMGPLGERGFIADFLKKHGQGVHHLAIEVSDIEQATVALEKNGIRIFGRMKFKGMRFTFLHPASTLRVGMQLVQRKPQKQSHDPLIKGIDHVAIRVSDPDVGRIFFLHGLGAEPLEKGKDDLVNCTYERFMVGNTRFDLLYDFTGPSPASIADGLHHLAVKVDDLPAAMRHFKRFNIDRLTPWSDATSVFLPEFEMFGCLWRVMQS
jgi:methylmalonyl-CoA epimerase